MDNKRFLKKVAQFTKIALSEIDDLKFKLTKLDRQKQAEMQQKLAQSTMFELALRKAASALYESDFITDDHERTEFLKKARENPVYLAECLERVCKAADVASFGIPANKVKGASDGEEFDPVAARAFGYSASGNSIIDD